MAAVCVQTSTAQPFSITSEEILAFVAAGQSLSKSPAVLETIAAYAESRLAIEYKLIQSVGTCGLPKITALSDRLGGLNSDNLSQLLQKQIQNPAALHAVMCLTDAILYVSPYDYGSTLMNDRIRSYFMNLHTMGAPSAEGVVMTGKFDEVGDFMVIKSAKDQTRDALLHEGVVGIYGTNSLRETIPNFAYVFGGFKCSPPLVEPGTREVVTWCLNNENAVNYVLYENISPSVTLSQYIKTCTVPEFLQVYMQLLYASRTALQQIDFTHYDLHDENVLIRDVVGAPALTIGSNSDDTIVLSDFQIPYVTANGTEYLKTSKVACEIDYSRAHFKVPPIYKVTDGTMSQEEDLGVSGLTEYSIYPQRSWIMHDMYKCLMFCGRSALQAGNTPVASEIAKIFRYFNSIETLQQAVDEQWKVRYSLPLTEMTGLKFTIDNFAEHIRNVCDCSFISSYSEGSTLTCTSSTCLTEDQTYSFLGVSLSQDIPVPTEIISFYEIALRLYNSGREKEMKELAANFAYGNAMEKHIGEMNKYIAEMNQHVSRFRSVNLSRMSLEQMFTPGTLEQVKNSYINGGRVLDRIQRLKYGYVIGIEVAKRYEDAKSTAQLEEMLRQYNQYIRPGLTSTREMLSTNDKYLDSIVSQPRVQAELTNNGVYAWYWRDRKNYDSVFGSDVAQDLTVPTTR